MDKPKCTHCGEPVTVNTFAEVYGDVYHLACAVQSFGGLAMACHTPTVERSR